MQLAIVMIEPQNPGNIGAVARIMANFGYSKLILINPQCKLDEEARNRAKHAQKILQQTLIQDWKYLKRYDYLIGTAGKTTTAYNLRRIPINPAQCAERITKLRKSKIALLLGREGDGLYNHELQTCDFVVTVPTSPRYPSMNISHALCVLLYELFQHSAKDKTSEAYTPIDQRDKERLIRLTYEALDRTHFVPDSKRITQKTIWQRLFAKSFLTKREAYAIMGFLKKINFK
ncbi:MAG TPA: RNA methyltransferase [Candidatus Nanoarchaeia archaeon]|nr:RNA methyltransferase [Candidatus Nanoarchaeia archaeon]